MTRRELFFVVRAGQGKRGGRRCINERSAPLLP